MLASCRFLSNPIGNTGSRAALVRSRCISHPMKTIQKIPDKISVEMTAALFQAYWVPPDSSAKTNSTEAARRVKAPKRSTFRVVSRENLVRSRVRNVEPDFADSEGRNRASNMMATTPGGPLAQDDELAVSCERSAAR
jgi:hypothetical protein